MGSTDWAPQSNCGGSMSSARTQEAVAAYDAGKSIREVARQFGINYETMRLAIKRQGFDHQAFRGSPDGPWTPDIEARVRELSARGMTATEISRAVKRDIQLINRHLGGMRAAEAAAMRSGLSSHPNPKSIRTLCNGKEAEIVASNTQTVARCVTKRGGGFIVTTHEGGSGWSYRRLSAGAQVVILPGGEVRHAHKAGG